MYRLNKPNSTEYVLFTKNSTLFNIRHFEFCTGPVKQEWMYVPVEKAREVYSAFLKTGFKKVEIGT